MWRAVIAASSAAVTPCSAMAGKRTQNAASLPAKSVTARSSQPIIGGLE